MLNNPSELRAVLRQTFKRSPLTVGGRTFDEATTDEAIDEIVMSLVRVYMKEGKPTACEQIVGAFFVALIEKEAGVTGYNPADNQVKVSV